MHNIMIRNVLELGSEARKKQYGVHTVRSTFEEMDALLPALRPGYFDKVKIVQLPQELCTKVFFR